jgi:anthranilate synthase
MELDVVGLYRAARAAGRRPALLESLGCSTPFGRRTLLGVDPVKTAWVVGGRLFVDGREQGAALDLFDVLEEAVAGPADDAPGAGTGVFPAWIGFLSYEFARHIGLPANAPLEGLPEATFFLYPHGWAWDDGTLVERIEDVDAASAATPAETDSPPERLPALELVSDYPPEDYIRGVEEVQERIRAGWVYQVNLSHRFHFNARGVDPLVCYERLRSANPSPFFGIVEGEEWAVVSGSPERLFNVADGRVSARPIAGTRPRACDTARDDALEAEMRADRKEQAEHVMLVDLLRNDLSRVCEAGTVEVSEALTVERYSHVMHLVSEVVGRRRPEARLRDAVAAIFPGGTITGAPKESVMREVARLEPVARGAYTGALGYVSGRGVDFNILIRSFTFAGLRRATRSGGDAVAGEGAGTGAGASGAILAGTGYLSGGGGIVIESDPENEYLETRHKVEAQLHILGHGKEGVPPAPPRAVDSWRPPRPRRVPGGKRVAFVENHDSYSFNIVNYLQMLGADVRVIDQALAPGAAAAESVLADSTHVLVGPGPGDPWTAGYTLDWVAATLDSGRPFLGVCLGHQALGVHGGARLRRAPRPVHGEAHLMRHRGLGVLAGLPDPAPFTRYNSLVLEEVPDKLTVEAWSHPDDGRCLPRPDGGDGALVMAIAHREFPAWGVQFHPESMLSPHGLDLLANFLEMS